LIEPAYSRGGGASIRAHFNGAGDIIGATIGLDRAA
jgi:hypothetical protein